MQSSRVEDNLDPRLASELANWAANEKMSHGVDRINVVVDRERFVQTRNALTNAFVGLSGAIDEAVKAYVNHTNAVLDGVGGSTLDVSGLVQPFNNINPMAVAQLAQQAIYQNGVAAAPITPVVQLNPDGTRKKRQYKPRDPNAPKRPLTAYFRYLQEQRPIIQGELAQQGPNPEGGKAGDISKIATERWNALSKDNQIPYRKAYEKEMHQYYADVKAYKAEGGQVDDDEVDLTGATPGPAQAAAQADEDSDETDSDDSSSEESSDDDSEEEEVVVQPVPPPRTKAASGPKKIKAGADPVAPVAPMGQFSSLNPEPFTAAPVPTPNAARKRKADATEVGGEKKRGRKSKLQKEAEENAAAAALQLQIAEAAPPATTGAEKSKKDKKEKKEKKKKRKSEAA